MIVPMSRSAPANSSASFGEPDDAAHELELLAPILDKQT